MDQVQSDGLMSMSLETMLKEADLVPADEYDTQGISRCGRTITKRKRLIRQIKEVLIDYNGKSLIFTDSDKGDVASTVTQFYKVLHTFGKPAAMTVEDFSNMLWGLLFKNVGDDGMFQPTAGEAVLNAIVHSGMFSTREGREIVFKVCDKMERGIPNAVWKQIYNRLDGTQTRLIDGVVSKLLGWARHSIVSIDSSTHLLTVSAEALLLLEPGIYASSVLDQQTKLDERRTKSAKRAKQI